MLILLALALHGLPNAEFEIGNLNCPQWVRTAGELYKKSHATKLSYIEAHQSSGPTDKVTDFAWGIGINGFPILYITTPSRIIPSNFEYPPLEGPRFEKAVDEDTDNPHFVKVVAANQSPLAITMNSTGEIYLLRHRSQTSYDFLLISRKNPTSLSNPFQISPTGRYAIIRTKAVSRRSRLSEFTLVDLHSSIFFSTILQHAGSPHKGFDFVIVNDHEFITYTKSGNYLWKYGPRRKPYIARKLTISPQRISDTAPSHLPDSPLRVFWHPEAHSIISLHKRSFRTFNVDSGYAGYYTIDLPEGYEVANDFAPQISADGMLMALAVHDISETSNTAMTDIIVVRFPHESIR